MKNNYSKDVKNALLLINLKPFVVILCILLFNLTSFNTNAAITPSAVTIYNYGGSDQLAFNNSIIGDTAPVFRVATSGGDNPTNFQIEINTQSNFTGTDFLQTFTASYIEGAQYNLAFTNNFTPVNGATYYVRAAASADSGNTYGPYSSGTYSFTYQSGSNPSWYQTTQAQFQTDSLTGTTATDSSGVQTDSVAEGANVFTNGSFESALTSWTTSVYNANGINKTHYIGSNSTDFDGNAFTLPSPSPVSNGTNCLMMCNDAIGYSETSASGDYIAAQKDINLTGVHTISFYLTLADWGIGTGNCTVGHTSTSRLYVYIDPANSTAGTAGNLVYTSSTISGTCLNQYTTVVAFDGLVTVTLPSGMYGANCSVKFVFASDLASNTFEMDAPTCYIDNVRGSASAGLSGTIVSASFSLASVQGATGWSMLQWNQALNGGAITLAVQKSVNGTWTNEATGITSVNDGLNIYDISSIPVSTAFDSLRIVATLASSDSISPSLEGWMITTTGSIATGIHASQTAITPVFDAYPNPASDEMQLDFYNIENQNAHLEIVNEIGQIVYTVAITAPKMILSTENLSNGIYLARLVNTDHAQSLKIVVEH